jgi:tetratricopeptide (TPR) repeat protein
MDRQARLDLSILVVEDHFNMRWSIVNMLRAMGYHRIAEAENGKEAWERMQIEHFGLVIADWIMPVMKGIDLLRKIRGTERFKKLPFLMVTGKVEEETVAEAAETEVDAYITKPFVAQTLEEKMNQILHHHRNPNEEDILLRLGSEHLEAGRYEAALREFERARMVAPENGRALCLLAEARDKLGHTKEAEDIYLEAIDRSPLFIRAYEKLAGLYERTGLKQQAADLLSRAARISPRNVTRQMKLGRLLLESGDPRGACRAFSETMRVSDGDGKLRTEIGDLLLNHGMAGEAAQAFEGAIRINPLDVHAYNRLGIAYRKQGKYGEALKQYRRAIQISPDDEHLYYNLGRALMAASRQDDAKEAFETALKLNPGFSEVKDMLNTIAHAP